MISRPLFGGVCTALLLVLSASTAKASFPSLTEVVEKARVRGPLTILATAEVRVAGATRYGAGLAPLTNPYLEVFVDRGTSGTVGLAAVQANLWLPIELAGQRDKRLAEVDAMVKWKQTAKSAAASNAVGEAVIAYGELLVASMRLREAIDGEKIAREEAAYVAGRFEAKDATAIDKALADGEVARWLQAKSESELAVALAKARLAIAIADASVDTPSSADKPDLPALKWKDGEALAKYLLEKSPALQAQQFEADYFLASKRKWEADKYAPVNFILSAGRGDAGEARFGGGLSWTFPVLRRNQSEIAKAEADADRALKAREVAAAALVARAKSFHAAYNVARSALGVIDEQAIPAAQTVVDASVTAWKAGKIELTRVFLARRDLASAKARRLDVAAAGWRAYGDLATLVGDIP